MSWTGLVLLLGAGLGAAFPAYEYVDPDLDPDLATFDYYRSAAAECGACVPELCPPPRGCRAGLVPDACGCCRECGGLEDQACDLRGAPRRRGRCGPRLECRRLDAEPRCVCVEQEPLCASDGRTYMNVCRFQEAAFSSPGLNVSAGPCKTVPVIKVPPRGHVNVTGSSVVLLCEVFAFPMALVEWRKEGSDVVLPGDDPHISVQSRGGPQKYELSSWLQIEEAGPADSGTYRCTARNRLGSVSAAAPLRVLPPGEERSTSDL
uniref:Kazal-type serine protease inhibitor domain-containing protein 1 n=1 Tax=Denticeps clupeoides TaxID=299321 RepID=A0AAY4DAL5_9TELE